MKIRFTKAHNIYKSGQVADVPEERAKHWIKVGAAVVYQEKIKRGKNK